MSHHRARNILTTLGEAPVQLKGLEQDGETEPRGASFVAEQFTLVRRECPEAGEFIRVPVLLHISTPYAGVEGGREGQRNISYK